MTSFTLRLLVVILILSCSFFTISWYSFTTPVSELKALHDAFPLSFNDWNGENLTIPKDDFEILQTDFILLRQYRNQQGRTVTLSVVYFPHNKISFHPPEACLGGVGYTITEEGFRTVSSSILPNDHLNIKWLRYDRNTWHELIYYFFETNNFITPDYLTFRWQMLLNQLKYKQTNGALIRVSTLYQSDSSAQQILDNFLQSIFPFIVDYLKF